MVRSILILSLWLLSQNSLANPDLAFKKFQDLKGRWSIKTDGKVIPIEMTYGDGSKGSIVTEQFGKELSVFYKDGDRLLMSHFCNAGNQPRLQLKNSSQPNIIEFEMLDITGLKSKDAAHVQRVIYKLNSKDQVDLELVWKKDAKEESEKYSLTRISAN